MLKQLVVGMLGVACSIPVFAEVLVQAPEQLVVVAINDQEVRGGLFGGRANTYKIDAGQHQIAVKYQELFEENYINHDIVRSGIVTLSTGQLTDGQTYQLVLINPPKNHDEAKAFADQPVVGLKDAQGNLVAQQTGANAKQKPWFGSSLFGSDRTVDLRQDKPVAAAPVAVIAAEPAAASVKAVPSGPVSTLAAAQSRDQQLIELWKAATPQERQKFSAWLAEQAAK